MFVSCMVNSIQTASFYKTAKKKKKKYLENDFNWKLTKVVTAILKEPGAHCEGGPPEA